MRGVKEISPEVHCPKLLFPFSIIAEHSTRSLEDIPNCQTTKYCNFFPVYGFFFPFSDQLSESLLHVTS